MRGKLDTPAICWVMLPAGEPTESTIDDARRATRRRATSSSTAATASTRTTSAARRRWREKGIHYVDVGTSGGVWGLERGYCMMIGGDKETVDQLDPIFDTLAPGIGDDPAHARPTVDGRAIRAPRRAIIHAGPPGAGHFVKMVHNGIEYGLMQAYAEGFDILKGKSSDKLPEDERFDLNLTDIAEVWRRGQRDLVLAARPDGDRRSPRTRSSSSSPASVADSGEGQWTIDAAMEEAVPANVLTAALFARYRSRVEHTFGDKLLSAMRFGFGGHVEMPQ